ncbi:unnamed protein product, partial [Ectocarpus sp. 12 AP-2014]
MRTHFRCRRPASSTLQDFPSLPPPRARKKKNTGLVGRSLRPGCFYYSRSDNRDTQFKPGSETKRELPASPARGQVPPNASSLAAAVASPASARYISLHERFTIPWNRTPFPPPLPPTAPNPPAHFGNNR